MDKSLHHGQLSLDIRTSLVSAMKNLYDTSPEQRMLMRFVDSYPVAITKAILRHSDLTLQELSDTRLVSRSFPEFKAGGCVQLRYCMKAIKDSFMDTLVGIKMTSDITHFNCYTVLKVESDRFFDDLDKTLKKRSVGGQIGKPPTTMNDVAREEFSFDEGFEEGLSADEELSSDQEYAGLGID